MCVTDPSYFCVLVSLIWMLTCCKKNEIAEQREHKDLIQMVCSSSSPRTVNCQTSNHIPSQHKRKLRSLALCPTNDQLFVTRYPSVFKFLCLGNLLE
ncbi:hypothetical protein HanHA300_Chr05g0185511 [Helianthus annuus]|nr:hypothetical protein HanHA300_Chr05g0185511 [Helianthus annuus]